MLPILSLHSGIFHLRMCVSRVFLLGGVPRPVWGSSGACSHAHKTKVRGAKMRVWRHSICQIFGGKCTFFAWLLFVIFQSSNATSCSLLKEASISVLPPFTVIAFVEHGESILWRSQYEIGLWDLTSGENRYILKYSRELHGLSISPDEKWLATIESNRGIRVLELSSGKEIAFIPFPALAGAPAFSPDGTLMAASDFPFGKRITIFRTDNWQEVLTISTPSYVDWVAFSPDGTILAAAEGKNLFLWRTNGWENLERWLTFGSKLTAAAFSPRAPLLVLGFEDGSIVVLDTKTFASVKQVRAHTEAVTALCFDPAGMTVASGSADDTVRLWKAALDQELCSLDLWCELEVEKYVSPEWRELEKFISRVYSLTFSHGGRLLGVAGVGVGATGYVHLLSIQPRTEGDPSP